MFESAIQDQVATSTTTIVNNDNTNATPILNSITVAKTEIVNNDNTNTANIIANDNSNTVMIIANDNANATALRDLLRRTQIEADLAEADNAAAGLRLTAPGPCPLG